MTDPIAPGVPPAQDPTPASAPAPKSWGRRHLIPVTAVAAVVVAGGVTGGVFLLGGGGSLTLHGAEAVCSGGVSDYLNSGTSITPEEAYPDMTDGAQVVVTNSSGSVIGTGSLASSNTSYNALTGGEEDFKFTVTVPAGESRYGITIGHNRGTIWFSESQLRKGPGLSLGC